MTAQDKIEAGIYLISMVDSEPGFNPIDEAIRILNDIKCIRENIPF
jgi:hypothetical protein